MREGAVFLGEAFVDHFVDYVQRVFIDAELGGDACDSALGIEGDLFVVESEDVFAGSPGEEVIHLGADSRNGLLDVAEWAIGAIAPSATFAGGIEHGECDVAGVTAYGMADELAGVELFGNGREQPGVCFDDAGAGEVAGGLLETCEGGFVECFYEIDRRIDGNSGARNRSLVDPCHFQHSAGEFEGQCAAGLRHAVADIEFRQRPHAVDHTRVGGWGQDLADCEVFFLLVWPGIVCTISEL